LGASDLYHQDEIEIDFFNVLDWAVEHRYKVIFLGDIFDYWMEFDSGYYPNKFEPVLSKIKQVIQVQGPLLYITGNHDNWTKGYLESIGCEIEENSRKLCLETKTILLVHGDGLLQSDKSMKRPLMHKLLRNKSFVTLYQAILPNKWALNGMQWFSIINRKFRPTTPKDAEKLDNWVKHAFNWFSVDTIIAGHDHNPRSIRLNGCNYLNLGAFYEQKTFALYTKNTFELVYWDRIENQPKPYIKT
jgi:UDP-2,3-diacylglucosamine hydrolase